MHADESQDRIPTPQRRSALARLRVGLLSAALTVGMASAIIWAKLRLVGDVPRTVYAEPDAATGNSPEPESESNPPEDATGNDQSTDHADARP